MIGRVEIIMGRRKMGKAHGVAVSSHAEGKSALFRVLSSQGGPRAAVVVTLIMASSPVFEFASQYPLLSLEVGYRVRISKKKHLQKERAPWTGAASPATSQHLLA